MSDTHPSATASSSPQQSAAKARIIDAVILLALVAAVVYAVIGQGSSQLEGLQGAPAPPFKLKTLSGATSGPADHPDKVVILDFWATWCQPCRQQMPALHQVMHERRDEVVILAINVDDPHPARAQALQSFLREEGLQIDPLVDDGEVQLLYGVERIPSLIIIGPDGNIAYTGVGLHTAKQIKRHIDAARSAG